MKPAAGAIAEGGGLIGDVATIHVGGDSSVREITPAVEDHDQVVRIVAPLNDLDGVEVLWAYPEIDPEDAVAAGAAFAADGTSVNDVLGYPGIFRGALLSGAEEISLQMKLAAAEAIASLATGSELVPDALDPEVHEHVATAVRDAAIESNAARLDRAPTGL